MALIVSHMMIYCPVTSLVVIRLSRLVLPREFHNLISIYLLNMDTWISHGHLKPRNVDLYILLYWSPNQIFLEIFTSQITSLKDTKNGKSVKICRKDKQGGGSKTFIRVIDVLVTDFGRAGNQIKE